MHVLSTPPAFVLSQDQTLHKKNQTRQTTNKLAKSPESFIDLPKTTRHPHQKMQTPQNKSQRHKLHDTLLSSQTSHASGQTSRSVPELVSPTHNRTPMNFELAVGMFVVTEFGERGRPPRGRKPDPNLDLAPRRSLATRRTLQTRPDATQIGVVCRPRGERLSASARLRTASSHASGPARSRRSGRCSRARGRRPRPARC